MTLWYMFLFGLLILKIIVYLILAVPLPGNFKQNLMNRIESSQSLRKYIKEYAFMLLVISALFYFERQKELEFKERFS
jgi:hypothetical protein